MSIPRAARLVATLHCLSQDAKVVITVQRWADQATERQWMRVLRNGQRVRGGSGNLVRDRQFSGARRLAELEIEMQRVRDRFAATALTEEQAWAKLRELAGVERGQCQRADRCGAEQILGWPYCPACGAHEARVASGALSGTRGRMIHTPVAFPARAK
jgi:hypothetical protein